MNELHERLTLAGGPFDVILDPNVGSMELRELGIKDKLEFDVKARFAHKQSMDSRELWDLISEITENLNIREDESEIEDRFADKVVKSCLDFYQMENDKGFWVTFWYDAGIGTSHRQEKFDLFIKPHSHSAPDAYEFYENKKKVWIQKIARDLRHNHIEGPLEMRQFNAYIKRNDMLWLMEDMVTDSYDIYDFLSDINKKL